MCLAYPGKVEKITGAQALLDYGGVKKEANISFLESCEEGDWVLVHVGFAIEKVDPDKAQGMYRLLGEQQTTNNKQ